MFELVENYTPSAEIKVIGVGGGGGNAVSQMMDANIDGVEFIAANTDAQALRQFKGKTVLQLGSSITKGLGAGANPEVGRQAALEDRDHIIEILKGADMVFITAGMGGGTGTGAAPVIAQAAKELGILTVAVVTKPFHFEARRRMAIAEQGIEELSRQVDSLITIPNAKLFDVMGEDALLLNAFKAANDVLQGAVQGIAELITRQGLINVDFADVRTVMSEMGMAVMGAGRAQGEDRAVMAVHSAIGSPLLEDINLSGARGVLVNITAGMNLTMKEFDEVGSAVADLASDDATVVIGTVIDPDLGDEMRVTVVATGLGERKVQRESRDQSLKVVRNATTGAPEPGYGEDQDQRTAGSGKADRAEKKTADMFSTQENIDYLDIPSFLRIQAD
ncbi:MAG: cell division protein FtsZ [Xanthomonadales bacterium]|nr:cell division protein FtsZ [Xanthomonadales bacterium]